VGIVTEPQPVMDQAEQDQLTRQVGRALLTVAGDGWTQVRAEYRSAGKHIEVDVFVSGPDGTPRPVRPPEQVVEGLGKLRQGMYRPGRGTWLSALYLLEPPSSFSAEFEPDVEPRWRRMPPPIGFADELRFYPRADEHIPEWLRQRAGLRQAGEPTPPGGMPGPAGGPGQPGGPGQTGGPGQARPWQSPGGPGQPGRFAGEHGQPGPEEAGRPAAAGDPSQGGQAGGPGYQGGASQPGGPGHSSGPAQPGGPGYSGGPGQPNVPNQPSGGHAGSGSGQPIPPFSQPGGQQPGFAPPPYRTRPQQPGTPPGGEQMSFQHGQGWTPARPAW
jgi:hypothetical protein